MVRINGNNLESNREIRRNNESSERARNNLSFYIGAVLGRSSSLLFRLGTTWALVYDLVDEAESLGFLGRHEVVTLHRQSDLIDALAGVLDIDLIETLAQFENFARLNLDIRRLTLCAA
jgi:hypothetical protein